MDWAGGRSHHQQRHLAGEPVRLLSQRLRAEARISSTLAVEPRGEPAEQVAGGGQQQERPSQSAASSTWTPSRSMSVQTSVAPPVVPPQEPPPRTVMWPALLAGAFFVLAMENLIKLYRRVRLLRRVTRNTALADPETTRRQAAAAVMAQEPGETVEWVNMCWRKVWRVYLRGLEQWIVSLLQPLFDDLTTKGVVPVPIHRLKICEFTLDHEAPYFSSMRRRNSRKDSDLVGVVDVRYTGGACMLLMIELGAGRWRFKVPVQVSDLDIDGSLWIKLRLAPLVPFIGTVSLAFVGPPNVRVQLSPYNRVRLMRIPVLQHYLRKLLTLDLPALMVLPKRLEINLPPAVTAVAEAAVGRDAVMRAVASAVLEADALEPALASALPLGPQGAAGGVALPDNYMGELSVTLREAWDLAVWGWSWQSNPYCRLVLGKQAVQSRGQDDTGGEGGHRNPVWNQEFEFLVDNGQIQELLIFIKDSPLTGRPEVGKVRVGLRNLEANKRLSVWLPVQPMHPGSRPQGELHLDLCYRPFDGDEEDSGFREAKAYAIEMARQLDTITDVKSAAAASSRAAVAASTAAAAIAMTKAAAARAATKAAAAAENMAMESFDHELEDLHVEQLEVLEDAAGEAAGDGGRDGIGAATLRGLAPAAPPAAAVASEDSGRVSQLEDESDSAADGDAAEAAAAAAAAEVDSLLQQASGTVVMHAHSVPEELQAHIGSEPSGGANAAARSEEAASASSNGASGKDDHGIFGRIMRSSELTDAAHLSHNGAGPDASAGNGDGASGEAPQDGDDGVPEAEQRQGMGESSNGAPATIGGRMETVHDDAAERRSGVLHHLSSVPWPRVSADAGPGSDEAADAAHYSAGSSGGGDGDGAPGDGDPSLQEREEEVAAASLAVALAAPPQPQAAAAEPRGDEQQFWPELRAAGDAEVALEADTGAAGAVEATVRLEKAAPSAGAAAAPSSSSSSSSSEQGEGDAAPSNESSEDGEQGTGDGMASGPAAAGAGAAAEAKPPRWWSRLAFWRWRRWKKAADAAEAAPEKGWGAAEASDAQEDSGKGASRPREGRSGDGPLEAVIISEKVDIEDIAREVERIREREKESNKQHIENLWARAVLQADRPWLILLCFLTTIALLLLAVVAYRLDIILYGSS